MGTNKHSELNHARNYSCRSATKHLAGLTKVRQTGPVIRTILHILVITQFSSDPLACFINCDNHLSTEDDIKM